MWWGTLISIWNYEYYHYDSHDTCCWLCCTCYLLSPLVKLFPLQYPPGCWCMIHPYSTRQIITPTKHPCLPEMGACSSGLPWSGTPPLGDITPSIYLHGIGTISNQLYTLVYILGPGSHHLYLLWIYLPLTRWIRSRCHRYTLPPCIVPYIIELWWLLGPFGGRSLPTP